MITRIKQYFMNRKNDRGFTLLELCMAFAILSILALIGLASYKDSRRNVVDAVALSEARGLGTAVYNAFLDQEDVDLTHNQGDGPQIGALHNDGNPRTPIFRLSAAMEADIIGTSDHMGTGRGYCDAEIWHPNGRKSFFLFIDEANGISSFPSY